MTAPAFGATDVLGLGSNWEAQNSSLSSAGSRVTASGDDGDIVASKVHNVIESGTATYIYIGEETNFPAAFAADSCDVGDVVATATMLITGISIDYSPCASGKRPLVTFTVRSGPTSAGATYVSALGAALPTYVVATPIVPSILTITAGDAEVQSSSFELTAQFGEDLDKDGEFLAGNAYGGEETITLSIVGVPTSITSTGYDQTGGPGATLGGEKSNTDYDKSTYTYVKKITRAA
jgi:hypothetical protein